MSATKRTKRAGRKQKHYETADGDKIKGLSRMSDGRWRVIGTQIRFTEPDETKAIAKFRRLTGQLPSKAEMIAAGVYMPLHPGTVVGRILNHPDLEENFWRVSTSARVVPCVTFGLFKNGAPGPVSGGSGARKPSAGPP